MNGRGMTLIELLLALALLSALTIACASWTTALTRAATGEGARASWRSAAEATLELVGRVISVEDSGLQRFGAGRRVRIEDDVITLATREVVAGADAESMIASGARLRVEDGVLVADSLDAHGRVIVTRRLLGEVGSFEVLREEPDRGTVRVTVRIVHQASGVSQRSWSFREGDVQ